MKEASDENLMARYADGNPEAFEELFARYEPRAYAYFLKRTASPDRAQDLYQELFLRIHRARHRFDPARPFAAWLFKIAHRLVVDDWRRAFRNFEVAVEDRQLPDLGASSEDCIAEREHAEQVLGALTPDEQYVLVSAKVEGISYSELAEQLGKSVAAVRKTASRATIRLRAGPLADVSV